MKVMALSATIALAIAGLISAGPAAAAPSTDGPATLLLAQAREAPAKPMSMTAKPKPPSKATISLNCGSFVMTLSTGSGSGTCTTDHASGTATCSDSGGNTAKGDCQNCKKTTGSGSCVIK